MQQEEFASAVVSIERLLWSTAAARPTAFSVVAGRMNRFQHQTEDFLVYFEHLDLSETS